MIKIFPQLNRHVAWALTALGVILLLEAFGCSIFRDIIKEHDQVCAKNIKVIVHDEKIWREYKLLAEASYLKRDSEYRAWIASDHGPKSVPGIPDAPPHAGRAMLEYVEGFDERYGENMKKIRPKGTNRPYADNQIIRDDLFLMKGDKVVLQIIDYIGSFNSIANSNGLHCLGRYSTIYKNY